MSSSPDWATHYKFYIKDNSSEYYNLAMDRFYQAESTEHVWLSFSSSDSNKISVDDFIILKKQHDTRDTLDIDTTAKYKVLAKESEAPAFIKNKKVSLGRTESNLTFATNNNATSGYPAENAITFTVRAVNIAKFTQTFEEIDTVQYMKGKFIKIGSSSSGASTDYYEIDTVQWSLTNRKAGAIFYLLEKTYL